MSKLNRIWALELANELSSSARIDGFDISPGQFTPQAWCGNHVHLLTHDAFKPFPPEYLGQYDIVHIRFFGLIANNEDAEPLLKNLITLLSKCDSRPIEQFLSSTTLAILMPANSLHRPQSPADISCGLSHYSTLVEPSSPIHPHQP